MATPNASRLAEIILKRSEPIQRTTEQVEILIDRQGADREGWQAAQRRLRDAEARVALLDSNPDAGGRVRMNSASPMSVARAEVDAARETADQLRDRIRDCFVLVTVTSLSEADVVAARAGVESGKALENALIAASITTITDHEGDPLFDMDRDKALGFVEWLRGDWLAFQGLQSAVNRAGAGVDFPT